MMFFWKFGVIINYKVNIRILKLETLLKYKEWIDLDTAWDLDFSNDSVFCCTMIIGLIESMNGKARDFLH